MKHHKKVPQGRLSQGLQPPKPPPQKNAPLSAAVESDVVGYTTITPEAAGYAIVSFPFEYLNGTEDGAYPIQQVTGNLAASMLVPLADKLMVLEIDKSYKEYYLSTDQGWMDRSTNTPTTAVVTPGSAIFINSRLLDASVVASGKVCSEEQVTVPITQGYNLVSNPYPIETRIADIKGTGLSASALPPLSDKIMVLNPQTKEYVTYYYTNAGWKRDGVGDETTDVIPVGSGFYYQKILPSEGSLTFTRPY